MTVETGTGPGEAPIDDAAVRDALEHLDQVADGERAKKARAAQAAAEAAASPPPASAYQPAVPVQAPPAYRPPVPVVSSSPFGDRPIGEVLGLSAPGIPSSAQDPYGAALPQPPRDMRMLEDVYVRFPDIGQGATVLRVERIDPKMVGTTPTAGWLGDLAEQISTNDFAARYGGGKYKVSVVGPKRDRYSKLPMEGAPSQTLAELEIRIQGLPNTTPEGYDMNTRPGPGGYPYPVPPPYAYGMPPANPQVEMRRMELEREREKEMIASSRVDPAIYQQLNEQGREMLRALERHSENRLAGAQAIIEDANARIRDLEKDNRKHLEDKVGLQREVAEAKNMSETQQIRELKDRYELQIREIKEARDRDLREAKDRHEDEMKRRMDEAAREKQNLLDNHRLQLESETRRHAEERTKLVDDLRQERDQTRDRTRDQIDLATKEHTRNLENLKENYENRIRQLEVTSRVQLESLERSLRDQLASEKSNHERELRSINETRMMMEKTTEHSWSLRVQSAEERLARAEEEAEELSRENRELHAKLNKPPSEYLAEVGDVAKNLLGMKTADEVKSAGEEDFSFAKVAASSVKSLIEKAPEVARAIGDMRQANPQAQAAAAAQAQPQLAHYNQQVAARQEWEQRQRQLAAQQQHAPNPARRPGENARPPQWAQPQAAPQAPRAAPPAASIATGQKRRAAPPPTTGFPSVNPMPSPVSERVAGVAPVAQIVDQHDSVPLPPDLRPPPPPPIVQAQGAPVPPPPMPVAPPPPPGPPPVAMAPQMAGMPPQQAQPAGAPGVELSVEALNEFFSELENAIRAKLSPKFFANEFVGKVGPETAQGILSQVTADQIIAQLDTVAETHPQYAASPILTMDGKKYVRDVFKHTAAIVGAAA